MKTSHLLVTALVATAGLAARADVVKCSATHEGQPTSLVVYIERTDAATPPGNVVLANQAAAGAPAAVVAHFRGDLKETGYDPDNGIQLRVEDRKRALAKEEKDGASLRRLVVGTPFGELNDLHILWWQPMQTAESFMSQLREDRSAGESSAEPITSTLECNVITASGVVPNNPESLHQFVERDLKVK